MKLSNKTISDIITTLTDPKSFRNDISVKIPAKLRFAIRMNEEKLVSIMEAYQKERDVLLKRYVKMGYATSSDGQSYRLDPEHASEISTELQELANVTSDIDLILVDADIIDGFLESVDLSIPEEKLIILMREADTTPTS